MTEKPDKWLPSMIQAAIHAAIQVCQSLFVAIILSALVTLTGLRESPFYTPLLGGILCFAGALLYLRTMEKQSQESPLIRLIVAVISAVVGAGGIAISLGLINGLATIALQPIPILLFSPVVLALLAQRPESISS